jgi:NodT family efflux transporter outer membrane factor (OMF) lipoprotein
LKLPRNLPLRVPSKLVEQRPDVRAAEALVHLSSAQVGVALANRLPQFSITATLGGVANGFGQMFDKGNRFWGLEGGVSQSVFDFGALKHKQRAAEAALDESSALYRQAVLTAFQNVADTLYALDSDDKSLNAAIRSEAAAKKTLAIVNSQLEAGDVNILAVWTAETAYHQAAINVIQARALQYSDTVALFQALGGSWKDNF